MRNLAPVRVGAGRGREDRIMENRRLKLKDGRETDVRHAYSLPRDEDLVGIGPIDPEIGLLRLDREDGQPLAVVYNFACHPIQGVPSRGNTADIIGFASKAIEENLGGGALAIFLQGCAGDINPVMYKDVHNPRDAEPLGNMLGLSALRALKTIATRDGGELEVINQIIALPRATDLEQRIARIEAEQTRLLRSLKGTSLNFKTFLPCSYNTRLSATSHPTPATGISTRSLGREGLGKLDEEKQGEHGGYASRTSTRWKSSRGSR